MRAQACAHDPQCGMSLLQHLHGAKPDAPRAPQSPAATQAGPAYPCAAEASSPEAPAAASGGRAAAQAILSHMRPDERQQVDPRTCAASGAPQTEADRPLESAASGRAHGRKAVSRWLQCPLQILLWWYKMQNSMPKVGSEGCRKPSSTAKSSSLPSNSKFADQVGQAAASCHMSLGKKSGRRVKSCILLQPRASASAMAPLYTVSSAWLVRTCACLASACAPACVRVYACLRVPTLMPLRLSICKSAARPRSMILHNTSRKVYARAYRAAKPLFPRDAQPCGGAAFILPAFSCLHNFFRSVNCAFFAANYTKLYTSFCKKSAKKDV